MAMAIADAIADLDANLILYGLSGSELIRTGKAKGIATCSEVFSDRHYQDDGSLTPRTKPHALITNTNVAVTQVVRMIKEKIVISDQGNQVQFELLERCDAVLMGRHTYDGFAPVWSAQSGDPFSDRMNTIPKYVVSTTLSEPAWQNTIVVDHDPIETIRDLKQQPGADIVQYGFGRLAHELMAEGLLDELRLWVHPLFVGRATADDLMFRPTATAQMELASTLALNTGIVILTYRVPSGR